MLLLGFIASRVEQDGFKNSDLLNSNEAQNLFLNKYKGKTVELKRIQFIAQLAGKSGRTRTVSLDAPFPVNSPVASINDYLQVVEIGRFRDRVIFSAGYSEEGKEALRELMNRIGE